MAVARGRARRGSGRRGGVRWWVGVVLGAVLLVGAAACAGRPAAVSVPTFAAAAPTPTAAPLPGPDAGHLPTDCAQIVGQDELPALFALPVGSVTVRTVQGVPAPSVGRLERLDCTYSVVDPNVSPQGVALRVTLGRYVDRAAARGQHDRNVADAAAGGSAADRPGLGDATASLAQRGPETVLLTCYDAITVDLDLAPRPVPLPPGDLLTDLARRVLARVVPPARADGPLVG